MDGRRSPSLRQADYGMELQSLLDIRKAVDAPVFPRTGVFSVRVWAYFCCCKPETIRRWIKDHNIPHKKPGDEAFIDAEDFHAAIPYLEMT